MDKPGKFSLTFPNRDDAETFHALYMAGYKAHCVERWGAPSLWWANKLTDWQFRSTCDTTDVDKIKAITGLDVTLNNGTIVLNG